MHSEHILPLNSPKIFGTLKGIFFVKYTTMLYQWQLVKNKVIQSNFPGNFHDKISLRISHVFRSDQFSLLMYCCLLPLSATVKMDYEENRENDRYATNDDTPL
jgi:hypothetical protein